MRRFKQLGLAGALALVAVSGLAGIASATTMSPASTAVTLSSTNTALAVSGGGSITCSSTTMKGTTPASGGATWGTFRLTIDWTGCTAFGFTASVTPNAACNSTAEEDVHFMSISTSPPFTAEFVETVPSACTTDVSIPSTGCTLTITGGQTIGNGTSGTGGIGWTNASPKSSLVFSAATVSSIDSNGVGPACSTAGTHTGTLSGNFVVSSATNVTITP
jgi:hypothetical protein